MGVQRMLRALGGRSKAMTSQPSREYRRHHDVTAPQVDASAFRQGWRVHSRLDALAASGQIEAGVYQAATEYRAAWERILATGGVRWIAGGRGGSDAHARRARQMEALRRVREADAAIGPVAAWHCYACAVEDWSWAAIGRQVWCNPETARDRTAKSLAALARAWGQP